MYMHSYVKRQPGDQVSQNSYSKDPNAPGVGMHLGTGTLPSSLSPSAIFCKTKAAWKVIALPHLRPCCLISHQDLFFLSLLLPESTFYPFG